MVSFVIPTVTRPVACRAALAKPGLAAPPYGLPGASAVRQARVGEPFTWGRGMLAEDPVQAGRLAARKEEL